jgi:hypothetical protein
MHHKRHWCNSVWRDVVGLCLYDAPFSASLLAILFLRIPHEWLKIGIMEVRWIVRGTAAD